MDESNEPNKQSQYTSEYIAKGAIGVASIICVCAATYFTGDARCLWALILVAVVINNV